MFLDAKGQKTEDEYLTVCDETENRRSLESVSGPPLSDPEVLDNAWLMMLAGFETTAATLAAICFTLMRRVDVQNKMRQELYQIFHEKKSIDFDSVQKLPYMDAVIKEALRLYPPAFHVARYAVQDAELPGGELLNLMELSQIIMMIIIIRFFIRFNYESDVIFFGFSQD